MSSYQPYQSPQPGPYPPQSGPNPPQPGQPQMYGAPPGPTGQPYPNMPYPPGSGEHPSATVILVLGILGFFTGVTGIIAWVMGNKAKKECDSGRYVMTGSLKAGRILGIITTCWLIFWVAISIIFTIAIISAYRSGA